MFLYDAREDSYDASRRRVLLLAAVGCGRCITCCPPGIDLTEEVAAIRSQPRRATAGAGAIRTLSQAGFALRGEHAHSVNLRHPTGEPLQLVFDPPSTR